MSLERRCNAEASRTSNRASGREPAFEDAVCPREHDEEHGVREGIGQEAANGERARTGNAFPRSGKTTQAFNSQKGTAAMTPFRKKPPRRMGSNSRA